MQGLTVPGNRSVAMMPMFAARKKTTAPKPLATQADLQQLLRAVPKTELHVHLSGSTPIGLIQSFLREQGWSEDDIRNQTQLKARYSDLNDFLETYYKVAYHVKTSDHFRRATVAIVKQAARENVRYLELRSSILSKANETPLQVVQAIEAGLREGEAWVKQHRNQDIKTGLIVLAQRAGTPAQSMQSAELAVELAKRPDSRIIGFDLAGSESNHPVTQHAAALRYVKKHGLPLTVHAGETSHSTTMTGADSIKAALKLGADRIGHGLQSVSDAKLLKKVVKKDIPLEVCPDSNVKISEVPSYGAHPLPELLQAGAKVNLNSDNRMITPITLTEQLTRLYNENVLTCWEELKTISLNGVRSGFMKPMEKKRMERQFKAEFKALENRYRVVINQFFCKQCNHGEPQEKPRFA